MTLNFWTQFIITTAISLVEALVAGNASLSGQEKADLEQFVADGQKLLGDFGA